MTLSIKPPRDAVGLTDGQLLIDGAWAPGRRRAARGATRIPRPARRSASSRSPAPSDVDRAVRAARRAFDEGPWPRTRAKERIRVLRRAADLVREHADELLRLQALDNSVPLSFGARSTRCRPSASADIFDHHAGWIDKLGGETLPAVPGRRPPGDDAARAGRRRRRDHPVERAAAAGRPEARAGAGRRLHGGAQAVGVRDVRRAAPGRACSRRPACPPGVLNVVTGPGEPDRRRADQPPDGRQDHLHRQPRGRPAGDGGGRDRLQAGQPRARRQEPGARLRRRRRVRRPRPPRWAPSRWACPARRAWRRPGRWCTATSTTQFLADRRGHDRDGELRRPVRPGHHGVAADQRHASSTGCSATSTAGRRRAPAWCAAASGPTATWRPATSSRPTLFADVDNDMTIAREEIFGPVLAVVPFTDEDEAVRLANDTEYGLGGDGVDHRRQARHADGQGGARRHGRHQRLPVGAARRVRRVPAVGDRPRGRAERDRGLHRGEDRPGAARPKR